MNRRVFGIFAKSCSPYRFRGSQEASSVIRPDEQELQVRVHRSGAHLAIGKVKAANEDGCFGRLHARPCKFQRKVDQAKGRTSSALWLRPPGNRTIVTRIGGQLILDDPDLAASLMMAGAGLGLILEQKASPYLSAGRLVRVLDEWCIPFQGLHLYYPSRHVTPALRALTDALKWKAPDPEQA